MILIKCRRCNLQKSVKPKKINRGRKPKGGEGIETTSITVRAPKPFKDDQIKMARESGFDDLSSYVIKILSTYTLDVKLKKIDKILNNEVKDT